MKPIFPLFDMFPTSLLLMSMCWSLHGMEMSYYLATAWSNAWHRYALQHRDHYYHRYYYHKLFNHFLLVRNVGCFQFVLEILLEGTFLGIMLLLNFAAFLQKVIHL